MSKIKVFLVDDHKILREALIILLSQHETIEVAGEAADGIEALKNISRIQPDIAIVDISLPKLNGIDVASRLKQDYPQIKVIILTMHKSEEFIAKALQAGVKGYILKDNALEELIQCIETVYQGDIFLSQGVTQHVVNSYIKNIPGNYAAKEQISSRERGILQLLAEGKSNKEISDMLSLSIKTVETHRANIMRKLGFKSVIDLVLYAVRNHIIEV